MDWGGGKSRWGPLVTPLWEWGSLPGEDNSFVQCTEGGKGRLSELQGLRRLHARIDFPLAPAPAAALQAR